MSIDFNCLANVFLAIEEYNTPKLKEGLINFMVNNVIWGNFEIVDEDINVMFG